MKYKILLFSAVISFGFSALTSGQNVPNYVPTNGLVGWWPFNGNANDESGNGNNGTVNGAILTNDRFGIASKAYSFNGSSNYIRINNSTSLNSTSVSISGWFNTNNLATNDSTGAKGIIGKWWQSPSVCNFNYNAYLVALTKPLGQTSTFLGGATNFYAGNVFFANTAISTNNWHHFVFVHNSASGGKLFINGILVNSYPTPGSICNSLNAVNIGADINNGNLYRFFFGKIDDIGIWNRALTQQEITNLYNANICYQTVTVTDTLLINLGITGFNPVTFNNTIKIFPNPTNDHITIDYGNFASLNGYQLRITNSLGQQMYQTLINQQSNYVGISSWTGNGLFFVYIIDPQGNTIDIKKIVRR